MKAEIENYIRAFGMSGMLICDELASIESELTLELGHTKAEPTSTRKRFYPQFEKEVRAEASSMAEHYEAFYCLEKSIRKIISETLNDAEGGEWWESARIPANIHSEVKKRIQREVDKGITRRSDDAIDYTTFGELSNIITSNWDLFGTIFTSQRAVENVMASLNLLRGPIAHCSPMMEDEADRLELAVKDWFRIIA